MVAMAQGSPTPLWPLVHDRLPTESVRDARQFGARRGDKKYHAGIDLAADRGTLVVAPETATVIGSQGFNGPNAHALLLETDSGMVILLGEVEPGSWDEFGLRRGSRVGVGYPVARVGINPEGGTMLHLETYRPGTRQNHKWFVDKPPPPELLDPTDYIARASRWWTHYPLHPSAIPPKVAPAPAPAPADTSGGLILVGLLAVLLWGTNKW